MAPMEMEIDLDVIRAAVMEIAQYHGILRTNGRVTGQQRRQDVTLIVEDEAPWGLGPISSVVIGSSEPTGVQGVEVRVLSKYSNARQATNEEWYSDYKSPTSLRLIRDQLVSSPSIDPIVASVLSTFPGPSCPLCRSALVLYVHLIEPTLEKESMGRRWHERVASLWMTRLGPRSLVEKLGVHLVIGGFLRVLG